MSKNTDKNGNRKNRGLGYRFKNRARLFFMGAVLLVLSLWLCKDFLSNNTDKPASLYSYREFNELVEQGKITEATIYPKEIKFKVTDDDSVHSVENPENPMLKERLLLNGVRVNTRKDAEGIFSLILDLLFYGVLIVIIAVVFRRFISPSTFKVVRRTGKNFSDVVGMESLKKDMAQIMDIMRNPAEWAKKGVRMPKGIIMEGAPGNGKTLFAKALAGEAKVNFIPAKATDFESMFMAIGPMKVKLLFRKARRRSPCIVFIDEFDGIGTRRNYSGSAIETENTRIVTALLNELDGFEPSQGVLVLAATNSISALDEALIRPGRFDARVSVPYPDENARIKLVEMYSRGKRLSPECTAQALAKKFSGFSCAKIESVLNRAQLIANQNERTEVILSDIDGAVKDFLNAK